jgi:hypothetical protein
MKVNISIQFDQEFTTAIKDAFREISEGIRNQQVNLDESDSSVPTQKVSEPKPKQTKPAAKRKPRAKQTLRGTVLKVVEKNKDGISRKELQEETGFSTKQISNYVYQLKKTQKIEMTEDGLLKPL